MDRCPPARRRKRPGPIPRARRHRYRDPPIIGAGLRTCHARTTVRCPSEVQPGRWRERSPLSRRFPQSYAQKMWITWGDICVSFSSGSVNASESAHWRSRFCRWKPADTRGLLAEKHVALRRRALAALRLRIGRLSGARGGQQGDGSDQRGENTFHETPSVCFQGNDRKRSMDEG